MDIQEIKDLILASSLGQDLDNAFYDMGQEHLHPQNGKEVAFSVQRGNLEFSVKAYPDAVRSIFICTVPLLYTRIILLSGR